MASSIDAILKRKLSYSEYEHVKAYIKNLEIIAKQTSVLVTEGLEPLRRHENFILYPLHEEHEMSDNETITEEEIVDENNVDDNGWRLHHKN